MKKNTNKKKLFKRSRKVQTRRLTKKKGGDVMVKYKDGDLKFASKYNSNNNIICWEKTCLAFNEVADQVKNYFNGFSGSMNDLTGQFTPFNFASKIIKRIGKPSVNGFVFEIKNETRGHVAYSVLKSAQNAGSDNLMYEYHVGLFINTLVNIFPCFLETYGLFKYKTEHQWEIFSGINTTTQAKTIEDITALQKALVLQPLDYAVGCKQSKHMAVLIQHLPGPKTMSDLLENSTFVINELIYALYQLYLPLSYVMAKFTHYDLHLDNILLYEPMKNKYIEYHYHFAGGRRVIFKSSYLLKIIDYGRSFFYDTEENNSKYIYDEILQQACGEPQRGRNSGFSWLEDDSYDPLGESKFYISAQHRNVSHDLLPLERIRLLYEAGEINDLPDEINFGLVQTVDFRNDKGDLNDFGKKENITPGYPSEVNNVRDAANIIEDIISSTKYMEQNLLFNASKEKLGELHIFPDSSYPMEFVPAAAFENGHGRTPYERKRTPGRSLRKNKYEDFVMTPPDFRKSQFRR